MARKRLIGLRALASLTCRVPSSQHSGQKVFLVPGIGPGDACDPKEPSCGETCTGFWNGSKAEAQMEDAILTLLKNHSKIVISRFACCPSR